MVGTCRWFHDTLVDGDLAINSMMWQVSSAHRLPLLVTASMWTCSWLCMQIKPKEVSAVMTQNAGKCGLDQWNFTLLPTSTSQVAPHVFEHSCFRQSASRGIVSLQAFRKVHVYQEDWRVGQC